MRSVLVVVSIAVATSGCKSSEAYEDYIMRSRLSEAQLELGKIGRNAKRTFAETSSYVVGTATQLPAKPGSSGCCGGPNNQCASDPGSFVGDATWKALDFQIDSEARFYYDYTGTATAFIAKATGDLDCDGTEITFELRGTVENGTPVVTLQVPPRGAD